MVGKEKELIRTMMTNLSRGAILWLLSQKPMSGYSVVKELEELTGQHLTPGVVYPLLYELEKEGFIVGEWTQKGRRRIKYYSMTQRGIELLNRLRSFLEMPVGEVLREFVEKKNWNAAELPASAPNGDSS
ncbi:MAG: PadR family transcriptional regulator [Candidatus Verstraetearchaeota archaeon]|nr:PadR family transcriptional regulator [Candidatus Verstraetearchaeota archaeon]